MAKKDFKSHSKKTSLKRNSDKRSKEVTQYHKDRKSFIEAQRALNKEGKIFCIFCGKSIFGDPDLHHSLGRDNDLLLDTEFWFLTHHYCHTHQYHILSCKDIPWWKDYMKRIKEEHPIIYNKELKREDKT